MANVFEGMDEDTGAVTPAAQSASAANAATSGGGASSFASGAGAGSAWRGSRSQGFGPTSEVRDGGYTYQGVYYPHFNKGTDFAAPAGSTIESPIEGTVIQAGHGNDGWDYSVKIRDAQGNTHNFGHMDPSMNVSVGQKVTAGMLLGRVGGGKTATSSGPHLSYDVWDSSGQFFDAVAQGGGQMSQTSSSGGGGGGNSYGDPGLDSEYNRLKDAFLTASSAWTKAGRPTSGPQYEAYWDSQGELENFTSQFGHPKSSATGTDPAQQAFENRIAIGDYELRQADSAFSRWFDKYSTAQKEATSTADQRAQHNIDNANMIETRNKSQTPGLLPRVTDAGYVETNREALLDQYLTKMGVGHTPPEYSGSGISIPTPQAAVAPSYPNSQDVASPGRWATEGADLMAGWERKQLEKLGPALPTQHSSPPRPSTFESQEARSQAASTSGTAATYGGQWQGMKDIYDGISSIASKANTSSNRGAASSAKKQIKKWWKKGFAEGGTNIPAQRAWTGERGPEIMELPGFGSRMVGMNGPEETDIPEGANIIPVDEAYAMRQIQDAARQGNQPDQQRQAMETQERMRDPQLQQKVMAAIQKALASDWASNPPFSPMLEDPARMKDYWAPQRMVTENPISQEEAMMKEQAAAKKPAAPAPAAPQGVV